MGNGRTAKRRARKNRLRAHRQAARRFCSASGIRDLDPDRDDVLRVPHVKTEAQSRRDDARAARLADIASARETRRDRDGAKGPRDERLLNRAIATQSGPVIHTHGDTHCDWPREKRSPVTRMSPDSRSREGWTLRDKRKREESKSKPARKRRKVSARKGKRKTAKVEAPIFRTLSEAEIAARERDRKSAKKRAISTW